MSKILSYLIIVCTVMSGSGCATRLEPLDPSGARNGGSDWMQSEQSRVPFDLRVIDEHNDGNRLRAAVEVVAQVNWPRDDVALRVSSLRFGEIVEVRTWSCAELRVVSGPDREQLIAHRPTTFMVSLPSDLMTDYQTELLWGADAEEALAGMKREVEVAGVALESSQRIVATLVNNTSTLVEEVQLRIVLKTSEASPQPGQLIVERLLAVRDAALKPGERRKLRISAKKELSGRAGTVTPEVHVVSFR